MVSKQICRMYHLFKYRSLKSENVGIAFDYEGFLSSRSLHNNIDFSEHISLGEESLLPFTLNSALDDEEHFLRIRSFFCQVGTFLYPHGLKLKHEFSVESFLMPLEDWYRLNSLLVDAYRESVF